MAKYEPMPNAGKQTLGLLICLFHYAIRRDRKEPRGLIREDSLLFSARTGHVFAAIACDGFSFSRHNMAYL